MLADAKELGRLGATDFEAAAHFGVSKVTLWRMRQADPELDAALRIGKDIADGKVEASLYHRAIGYSFPAEKIHVGKNGQVTRVAYTEHVPPDVTAMIFWLKNRKRADWTDQQNVNVNVNTDPADDPRKLAMAILAMIREGLYHAPQIEGEKADDDGAQPGTADQ